MRLVALALSGVILAGPLAAQEGDPEAGRKLAGQCRTCHGLDGIAQIPVAPNIGGEPAGYLARQLEAFRSGARVNEMMSVVAASLSDAQIADLAAWYASHVPVATLAADPADAPELCSACHGVDGISVIEDAPNLAGENSIYIETQLKAFRTGKRESPVMGPITTELSDEDIRAVADWYAATRLEIPSP